MEGVRGWSSCRNLGGVGRGWQCWTWDQSAVGIFEDSIHGGGFRTPQGALRRPTKAPHGPRIQRWMISTPSQARHARISSSRRCRAGRVVSQTSFHLPVLARLGYIGGYHLRAGRHLCPRDAQGYSHHLCPPALSPGVLTRGPTPGVASRWDTPVGHPVTPRLPPEGFVIPPTGMKGGGAMGDGRGGANNLSEVLERIGGGGLLGSGLGGGGRAAASAAHMQRPRRRRLRLRRRSRHPRRRSRSRRGGTRRAAIRGGRLLLLLIAARHRAPSRSRPPRRPRPPPPPRRASSGSCMSSSGPWW